LHGVTWLRTLQRSCAVALGCGLGAGTIGRAGAEPSANVERESARALADEGANAYAVHDDLRALALFQRAYALVPAPTIALFEARTLVRLGRLLEARAAYVRVLDSEQTEDAPAPFRAAVEAARGELAQLEAHLAPPAPPPPDPPAPPNPRRAWSFVALGAGGAGLTLGLTAGAVALAAHADAEDGCPQHRCVAGSPGADAAERFRTWRTVSTVGYVVGALGLGAGVTLLLTSGHDRKHVVAVMPALNGGSVVATW
jgi:hypothetical protein